MKVFLKIAKGFLLLILTLAILLLALWAFPQWMTNKKLIAYGLENWLPKASIQLEKIDLDLQNINFWEKRLQIDAKPGLCAGWGSSEICFEKLYAKFHLVFPNLTSSRLEKIEIKASDQKVTVPPALTEDSGQKEPFYFHQLVVSVKSQLKMILGLPVDDFSFSIKDVTITYSGVDYHLNLSVSDNDPLDVSVHSSQQLEAKAFIDLHHGKDIPWNLQLKLGGSEVTREIQSSGEFHRHSLASSLDLSFTERKNQAASVQMQATIAGEANFQNESKTLLEFREIQFNRIGLPAKWTFKKCRLLLRAKSQESTVLECPDSGLILTRSAYENQMQVPENIDTKVLPEKFQLDLRVGFSEAIFFSEDKSDKNFLKVNIDKFKALQKKYNLEAQALVILKYVDSKIVPTIKELKVDFDADKVRELFLALSKTDFAIPAPINQLNGRIKVAINSTQSEDNLFKLEGKMTLNGPAQMKFVSTFDGDFKFDDAFNFISKDSRLIITIDKAYFYIPDFDPIAGIPPVTKDSRLVEKKKLEKKKLKKEGEAQVQLPLHLTIKTSSNRSIRLYYKLFEPYLVTGFSCQWSENGLDWRIQGHEGFDISYLKRTVTVRSMSLRKSKVEEKPANLDIELGFEASEYDVTIQIKGTTDKPQLVMSSQPYLADEDIVSLLLYNRTRNELTSFESENVGGTQAAITDRAVGLFGLWLFASTPVESVSYNSATNTYQAQLSLPGKLRLSVGTDWEEGRFVGLGRRIGGGWMIMTEYELDENESVGNIYLQKEFFY